MKGYLIRKGKHSSGFHLGLTLRNSIGFIAQFDDTCLYNIEGVDKYDINKLFGFSTTWFHHRQSARVGWRCLDGKNIQLVTYSYNKGVREPNEMDVLGVVAPNEKFVCKIVDTESTYVYTFEKLDGLSQVKVVEDKKASDWFIFHYYLYPYFGGNNPAPHDMRIKIQLL